MAKKSTTPESIFSPSVAELVAIGAAIGANCEPCFKYHYSQARKLGVSREDMARAVALADKVKQAPARNMLSLADKVLRTNYLEEGESPLSSGRRVDKKPKSAKRESC